MPTDFGSILYAAQNNTGNKSKETRCYKTTFEPPKKEVKPKHLSANVQKFLQKQEEEKRRKEIEAKKKREELLALRSQDKMSQKRMSTMLKRTKSANKSVMEDAIDDVNTSVTMAGPQQCDEDDYGYVSQEASSFYNKMMEKYTSMPSDEPSFLKPKKGTAKDLSAAKERVRAALNRVEEEEMLPRKRKRKTKESEADKEQDDFIDDSGINYKRGDEDRDKEKEKEKEKEKQKKAKRPPMPPPMDFQSLLKLAEQKQHEPVVIDKKRKRDSSEDEDEEEEDEERKKLMTKRQRLEYEREKEARMQREKRRMEEAMRSRNGGSKQSTEKGRSDKREGRERERSLERESNRRERPDKDREQVRSRSPSRSSTTLKGGGSFKIPKTPDASRTSSESTTKNSKTSDATRTSSESVSKTSKPPDSSRTSSSERDSRTSKTPDSSRRPSPESKISKTPDSSRSSSESAQRIPKLSDKTNKPTVLDNKKRLPSSVVEEKLKKSSDVWSKPCNLSPSSKKLQPRSTTVGSTGSSKNPLEDKLNKLMDEIRSVKQASTKLDLEDKLEMLARELDEIKRERSRVENGEIGKKVEKSSNGSLDRRKDRDGWDERKSSKPLRSDENCEKHKYIPTKIPKDADRRRSDVPKPSSSSSTTSSSKHKPDSSDRLKDDRSPKVNGYKPTPIHKLNSSGSRVSSPVSKSSKLKSVDLFGDDFPDSTDSADPRKSNGDYNKPSMAATKQSLSKPSLAKAAELAGKQRDLKSSASMQKPAAQKGASNVGSRSGSSSSSSSVQSRKFPPDDLKPRPGDRPRSSGTDPVRSRQFPPPDVRSRQFPPNDIRRRRPSPSRSSRYYDDEDDEDEYDSEMDDFIDYGDGDNEDSEHVSEIISEIFKYNPSQFSIGDDDDECMESNFGQIDKEEIRSLHIGLREDLEDIRREQAEKKEAQRRKLQKMADMRKNRR